MNDKRGFLMNLRRSILMGHLIFMLLHFVVLGCLVLFSYLTWCNYDIIDQWSKVTSKLAFIMLVFQLISFKYKRVNYTDFRLWFIILSYLFMFGRVFLHAYGLDSRIFWNLMPRYSSINLYHASMYILCVIESLFIGFILRDNQKKIKGNIVEIGKAPKNNLMYNAGILLLAFSIPFRLFTDITWILQTQVSSSYSSLAGNSGLADDFAFLMVPSIIYIITSGRLRRKSALSIVLLVVGYFVIVMILTGDRRYQVTAIFALILCYLRLYGVKFKVKQIIIWGVGGLLILNFFTVIREVRGNELTSLGTFFKYYGSDILLGTSTLYETLAEFGLTFFSVVHILEYVPQYISFQYGFSFIASIPSVLPIGWLFENFFHKASLSGIINPIAGAPVGASLIGDLYGNFSWFAIFAGIIIGTLTNKIFRMESSTSNRLRCAQYYSLFYILINLVRATFIEIFRPSIMIYCIPLFIMWILKKNNMRIKIENTLAE